MIAMTSGIDSQSRRKYSRLIRRWAVLLQALVALYLVATSVSRADDSSCIGCHGDSTLFEDQGARTDLLVIKPQELAETAHGGLDCVDCHMDLAANGGDLHDVPTAPVDCSRCHPDEARIFAGSWHGQVRSKHFGDVSAPTCVSCHGSHDIYPGNDPRSKVHPKNLARTCASCHIRLAKQSGSEVHLPDAYERYIGGIHAKRISQGILGAATCNDCHGYHDLRKASDPLSKVYKYNIPKTCGHCHSEVYQRYERGIHGQALASGVTNAPTCTDCHGEHRILEPGGSDVAVSVINLSDRVCARCHNNRDLIAKYGLKGGRISSYQDSYHGMATRRGSTKAATCASCHRAHDILPPSDPASSIAPGQIVSTCRKCHLKANAQFAASYTHEAELPGRNNLKGIITLFYIPLIIVIVGGMAVHNGIILFYYFRRKKNRILSGTSYERFSRAMVLDHYALAASFIVLVITGFALRFPDAWWAWPLDRLGLSEGLRGIIHRTAACIMIAVSVHHVVYVILSRRGRTEFRHILPRWSDLRQARDNLRYYLGRSSSRADFDRYDYTEKAEYWALVWGTAVMALTGFVLWFPEFFTSMLPGWIVIASETVHYYEAWLAMLSIVIWHFFFVIFHPEEYPMSFIWLHGRMSEEELKERHPAWYRRIAAAKQAATDHDSIDREHSS